MSMELSDFVYALQNVLGEFGVVGRFGYLLYPVTQRVHRFHGIAELRSRIFSYGISSMGFASIKHKFIERTCRACYTLHATFRYQSQP